MGTFDRINAIFRHCREQAGERAWQQVIDLVPTDSAVEDFPTHLADNSKALDLPAFLPDLAGLELRMYQAAELAAQADYSASRLRVNPTLALLTTGWRNLERLLRDKAAQVRHEPGETYLIVWHHPETGKQFVRPATPEELLALKITVEELDKRKLAEQEQTTLAVLDRAIEHAVRHGILLEPDPTISRNPSQFAPGSAVPGEYLTARVFTLQWHLTQACDLHCKHCYDRSSRAATDLPGALALLDQLYDFCQVHHVFGQVSFSGGNPLLHPDFFTIYRAAADRGFLTAILGNPTDPATLQQINDIQKPEFYQVSLEGLREHNDAIRGQGFFDRVMGFLDDLREAGIYSMVMLTLTHANMDQVLPLAELLRGKADLFTFNRLSMVGEGAQLATPARDEYELFLRNYLSAAKENPVLALKDNLINIIRFQEGAELFGGCAGFGCGAAFNFVAVLPDGEVHACRKFPSPIGNLAAQGLADIYDSDEAARYRTGPAACRGCSVRHVCGGCLAVIASNGLDISIDRDPCCFYTG